VCIRKPSPHPERLLALHRPELAATCCPECRATRSSLLGRCRHRVAPHRGHRRVAARCSVPLACSHRGRRQADARSFPVLLVTLFLGSLCYSPRHVLSRGPLDAAVPLAGHHRPSSCFTLPPLSMPSYHDTTRGEREVRGGAVLRRVSASGRLGRRAEQLTRGGSSAQPRR
jgi:hypothetical protein